MPDVSAGRLGTEPFSVILEHKHFEGRVFVDEAFEILSSIRSVELIAELFRSLDVFRCSDSG